MISQIFVFLLCADASIVFAGLSQNKNMWEYIVAYWLILTAKNFVDFIIGQRNRNRKAKR